MHVVCSQRLSDMITHMKERLAGKIGNANNNAFMLRKLFKMYDTAGSGYVSSTSLTLHIMSLAADEVSTNSMWNLTRTMSHICHLSPKQQQHLFRV